MGEITRVFLHGLDSSSRGTKGSFFRARYPAMVTPDFSGEIDQRMEQLEKSLAGKGDLILVGSSYGGLMAALYACRNESLVRKLVLLAPALGLADLSRRYARPLQLPVVLYLGLHDTLVPPEPTRLIAERLFANLETHLVDDDHNLRRIFPTLDWNVLLEVEPKE